MKPSDAAPPEPAVFDEPWQAEAFALAVALHAAGAFSWTEWAEALSGEIRASEAKRGPDDGSRYYQHWLGALESLASRRALVSPEALAARRDAWEQAYQRTPHGQPVTLA